MAFKPGDSVRLKSGGPIMTIGGTVNPKDYADCYWFDPSQVPQTLYHHDIPITANHRLSIKFSDGKTIKLDAADKIKIAMGRLGIDYPPLGDRNPDHARSDLSADQVR
jgi:uncharacterized protein YodC (DUF2158 family)